MEKVDLLTQKVVLQPPFEVSPLIRGARWSFLLVGILYGAYKHRTLAKKEAGIREFQMQQKIIKDEHDKKLKKWMNEEEMKYLSKELGANIV